jgi:hypothetical protein
VSNLAAELAEAQRQRHGKPGTKCTVCAILAALDEEDRRALESALGTRGVYVATIVQVLRARGLEATSSKVQHHRLKHVDGWLAR